MSLLQFFTTYLDDPWNIPSLSTSQEETIPMRVELSLSIAEAAYQATLDLTMDLGPSPSRKEEEDIFALHAWEFAS